MLTILIAVMVLIPLGHPLACLTADSGVITSAVSWVWS
jgi:hypothetical protein